MTGLDYSVLQIKTKIVSCHTADSKPVKQEVNGSVILPPSLPCTNKFKSFDFKIANITYFLTKQATLMRRSTVLSLPLQLVFPGLALYYSFLQVSGLSFQIRGTREVAETSFAHKGLNNRAMTLGKMTIGTMTLNIKGLHVTLRVNDTQHNNALHCLSEYRVFLLLC